MSEKKITISRTEIANAAIENAHRAGSTEWDIYANIKTGDIDDRHNTHDNREWVLVYDCYYGYPDGDEGVGDVATDEDRNKALKWLLSDGLDFEKIKDNIKEQMNEEIIVEWVE